MRPESAARILSRDGRMTDTSLSQALFEDLKNSLSKDLNTASKGLQQVVSNSDQMEAHFREALQGQQVDRMTLYSTCIITLVVAIVCVIVIGLMWCHVVNKINHLIDVMSACEERLPLTQSNNRIPIQTTSFGQEWMGAPSGRRAIQ